jgi:hypothetical protein
MKACAYCGRENDDGAAHCSECGTFEFKRGTPEASKVGPQSESSKLTEQEFIPISPSDMEKDLVVLMKCRTLLEAEMIVSQLEATGIYSFIPDQFLMQAVSWNLNTYGYVRVQVSSKDYAAAKEFLLAAP